MILERNWQFRANASLSPKGTRWALAEPALCAYANKHLFITRSKSETWNAVRETESHDHKAARGRASSNALPCRAW